MALYFATSNTGKYAEMAALIPGTRQLPCNLVEIQELDPRKVIAAKLREAARLVDGDILVDDTSLCMEGLNGLPGTLAGWFIKSMGDDGLSRLVLSTGNVRAQARTVLGVHLYRTGEQQFFEGVLHGTIVPPTGERGFGWDRIFQPTRSEKTFAQMTAGEKNAVSMRAIAARELARFYDSRAE